MSHLSLPGRSTGLDAVVVAPRVWLANRRRTRVWAAIAAAWSVAIVVLATLPGHIPADGTGWAVAGVVAFYAILAAAGLVLAWRVTRAGMWLGPEAIVIRGPFRTASVALPDAGRFTPGLQGHGGNGVPCPVLARCGRDAAGVWALGRRNIWFRYARVCAELEPLCDELNAVVAELSRTGV